MFESDQSCGLLTFAMRDVKLVVETLEPATMSGAAAAAMVREFAEVERLAAAGRLVLAHRVNETGAWQAGGYRSATEWMAAQTGGTLGVGSKTTTTGRATPKREEPASRS